MGSRSIVHFPGNRTAGKSQARFETDDRERRRRANRQGRGHPIEGPLNPEEVLDYLDLDPMPCLLCGRGLQCLGKHITMVHDMTVRDYCTKYAIPFRLDGSRGLATKRERLRRSDSAKAVPGLVERVSRIHLLSPRTGGGFVEPMSKDNVAVRGLRSKTAPRICPECGRTFRPPHVEGLFCSRICAQRERSRQARSRWHRCKDCDCLLSAGSQSNGVVRCMPCDRVRRSGSSSPTAKMTEEGVQEARLRFSTGNVSIQQIADEMGISRQQMARIIHGKSWSRGTISTL